MIAGPSGTGLVGISSRKPRPRRALPETSGSQHLIDGEHGPLPTSGAGPKPPPLLLLYHDLADAEDLGPSPVYRVEYPRPSHLLREAARVIAPGCRIGLVHCITARPVHGTRFVHAFGLSTGFDTPMRAVCTYERDQLGLALEGPAP
jgi:hypothetical protein